VVGGKSSENANDHHDRQSPEAHYIGSLLHNVCDVRDNFRTEFQDHLGTKDIYINVEKVS
jgi:hypothetical protein